MGLEIFKASSVCVIITGLPESLLLPSACALMAEALVVNTILCGGVLDLPKYLLLLYDVAGAPAELVGSAPSGSSEACGVVDPPLLSS